jgi:hypothetical protein
MTREYTHEERRAAEQVCPSCDRDLWEMTPELARDTEGVYTVEDDRPFPGPCPECGGELGGGRVIEPAQ